MIELIYGTQQQFCYRSSDINILGRSDAKFPINRSVYSLNGSKPIHFYVEHLPEEHKDSQFPYGMKTPSVHRLRDKPGYFNIEIPINHPTLRSGQNFIHIQIEDGEKKLFVLDAEFSWDPSPLKLPLELRDLSSYSGIQEIGQIVNGVFTLDHDRNVIRTVEPVGGDVLFLIGSPSGSQEAVYDVKFTTDGRKGSFIGVSDFFAGYEAQSPDLGIKPGYCTAGLVTITPTGFARTWMAMGDCLVNKDWAWVLKHPYPTKLPILAGITYRVRHQVIIGSRMNFVRFRIWKKGTLEPKRWLVYDNNAHIDSKLPRIHRASFGLFQYGGLPTEWSNITLKEIDVDINRLSLARQKKHIIFFKRKIKHFVNAYKGKTCL
jgi:hypothetical protein